VKAYEYLISRPLLVTPEALEAAVAIASRDPSRPAAVEARRGAKVDGAESGMSRRDGVAVIPITGPIFRYADWFVDLCGGATVEAIARDLRLALDDPACKAILLSIDSPGGEAAGIDELAGMVRAADAMKPVCAYVGHQGCSAAYWLASAAGEVVCAEASLLGSIGVVMGYPAKRDGARTVEFVSSQSPNKRPDIDTEKGRAEVQRVVDDLAEVFIASVARYRGTAPEKVVSDFGAGGVKVGKKAVEAGMADRVGTFEEVLSELSRREPKASGPSPKGAPSMFGFLFKPKADGSIAMEPITEKPADPTNPAPAPSTAAAQAPSADAAAKDREIAYLRLKLAGEKLETIKATAAGWYDRLFADDKVVPAEKDAALGAYVQAAVDDLAHPLAEGKTRVALVKGIYDARTSHTLCRDQIDGEGEAPAAPSNLPPGYKAVAHASDKDKPPTQARVAELMQHLVAAGQIGPEALPKTTK
jgi:capsid assembly protease